MGQKANPISLRLKATNKTFASSWYSDFYYPNLITQELKAREYLSKLFAQIRYPNPWLSISFLPKRTKTLVIYLNPFQSRRRGCERFQLRLIPEAGSFDPSIVFTRKNDTVTAPSMARHDQRAPLMAGGDPRTSDQQRGTVKVRYEDKTDVAIKLIPGNNKNPVFAVPNVCKTNRRQFLGEKYKRFFVQKLLLLTALHKTIRKESIWKKNHQFFQKLHYMTWFQGREENQSLLSSKDLGFSIANVLPVTSSPTGSNCKVTYSNTGFSFAGTWSKFHEREFAGSPQLTKGFVGHPLDGQGWPTNPRPSRGESKRNESTSFLSYQLKTKKKDQIHLTYLESIISKCLSSSTTLWFYKTVDETQAAHFMSNEIAYYLERRVPFRRIKQLLLCEVKTCYIEGVRVICSGRVGGRSKKAQRARGERFQWGQTSSHVFSSKLSFSSRSALTPFGKVGIKVWICYK